MESVEDKHDSPTQPLSLPRDWEDGGGTEESLPANHEKMVQTSEDADEVAVPKGWMRRVAEAEQFNTLADEEMALRSEADGPEPDATQPVTVDVPVRDEVAWREDEIDTPPPMPLPAEVSYGEPGRGGASCALRAVIGFCLVISLLSLALNAFLIYKLMDVQRKATAGLNEAIAALEDVGKNGFQYEFHFENTIPFSGDIPFKQDIVFPFEGEIPFNTTVRVPIDVGLIKTEVEVPVDTSVYVNTSVPIYVDETIHVDTEIPVSLTIPIDIEPGDPAIQKLVDRIREWLLELMELF
jgi:hypothetical protein